MTGPTIRLTVVFALIVSVCPSCKKDQDKAYERGEAEVISVAGLHQIVERSIAVSPDRVIVAGFSGEGLSGRLIWAQPDGTILADHALEEVVRPSQVAACVDGEAGQALYVAEVEGNTRIRRAAISGDGTSPGSLTREWLDISDDVTVSAVRGSDAVCGLCIADNVAGQLHCQTASSNPDPTIWNTGRLARWQVLQAGDGLVLVDWGIDDDRWVTVRIAPLPTGETQDFAWQYGYIVGQRPEISISEDEDMANPRFTATESVVFVAFVDHTEYYPRIFVQEFPLADDEPGEPVQIDDCRRTCDFRWFGSTSDTNWAWYNQGLYDFAVLLEHGSDSPRSFRFDAPRSAYPVTHELFKLGLGDDLGNWWAVFAREAD